MKKYVIANDTTINESNVKDWIKDFCGNIQPHLLYLDSFYQGKDDIKKYPYDKNRINNYMAYMAVQNVVSYCFGKTPTQDFKQGFSEANYIQELKFKNKENTEDKALEHDCSKLGLAYEFIGAKENIRGEKEPFYKRLDPLTSFMVVDDTILENKVCFITYTIVKPKNAAAYKHGFVYTQGLIIEFDFKGSTVTFTNEEMNTAFPDKFPVVLYKNNADMVGDYEPATEVMSAYSKLYSVSMDDHESIANALLLIYNADLSDDEKEKLNRTRVAALFGDNAKAEYIYKKLDSASFTALKEGLRAEFYAITSLCDMTDVTAYNKAASAILYKLIGMENIRVNKSAYFEEGMRERWDIIASYTGKKFDIAYDDITYTFYNNLPANIDNDITIMQLVEKGGMSLKTALKRMVSIEDAEAEYNQILAEKRMAMDEAIANIRSKIDEELENVDKIS